MLIERVIRHQAVKHVDDHFRRIHPLALGKVEFLFAGSTVDKEFQIARQSLTFIFGEAPFGHKFQPGNDIALVRIDRDQLHIDFDMVRVLIAQIGNGGRSFLALITIEPEHDHHADGKEYDHGNGNDDVFELQLFTH